MACRGSKYTDLPGSENEVRKEIKKNFIHRPIDVFEFVLWLLKRTRKGKRKLENLKTEKTSEPSSSC